MNIRTILSAFVFLIAASWMFTSPVQATHAWGPYHWARTANPFTLNLGDNVSGTWDPYLSEASADWTTSSVLNTAVVAGTAGKNCRATTGRVEVCNRKYGNNGWLGLAQIWINGSHITQALAKMNDTYFSSPSYNTPAWKRLVMCQEVAHGFGLDHQDEAFDNANLGSCMDYTGDPDGPPSNEHPNAHDYTMLETIYGHLDGLNTVNQSSAQLAQSLHGPGQDDDPRNEPAAWGKKLKDNGNVALYVRELGNGRQVYTHVFWAN